MDEPEEKPWTSPIAKHRMNQHRALRWSEEHNPFPLNSREGSAWDRVFFSDQEQRHEKYRSRWAALGFILVLALLCGCALWIFLALTQTVTSMSF